MDAYFRLAESQNPPAALETYRSRAGFGPGF